MVRQPRPSGVKERGFLDFLGLPEDGQRPRVEVDIAPPKTVAPIVVQVTEEFGAAGPRVSNRGDEGPLAGSTRRRDPSLLVVEGGVEVPVRPADDLLARRRAPELLAVVGRAE